MTQIDPRVEIEGMKSIVMEKLTVGKMLKATKRSYCEKCEVNCNNKKDLEDIK